MLRVERLTPAAELAPVVLIGDMLAYLRIVGADADQQAWVADALASATDELDGRDGRLNLALRPAQYRMTAAWPAADIEIPLGPSRSIVEVALRDSAGVYVPVSSAVWRHMPELETGPGGGRIVLRDGQFWPTASADPEGLRVTWEAGYGARVPGADVAPGVPANIVGTVKMLAAYRYENAGASNPGAEPPAIGHRVRMYRRIRT